MATENINSTDWNINTDIYDIVNSVNNLKKNYIPDEDEDTLALGIFGYVGDLESKKIQTSVIMTGELGNEMFPSRAKLTKNVLTHAAYNGVVDMNAIPATLTANIGIKIYDIEKYMSENRFVFDHECPLFIGDYEFHTDYDIIINRVKNGDSYAYSAYYDIDVENPISDIDNIFLKQPFTIQIENDYYLIFQTLLRQYTIEDTYDTIIADSVIESKTYTFDFENQIADFDVIINDNGKEIRLKPYLWGSEVENDQSNYCWYLYISTNTIRVTFDAKSYLPGLNTSIQIRAYTTLGKDGNFKYKTIDSNYEGLYVDLASEKFGYNKIVSYLVPVTDSENGLNRKTKEELQTLITKYSLSRGNLTNETDLENYFDLINTDQHRLVPKKKVDNNISRVWYTYLLMKDELNNIIPTNSIKIELSTLNGDGLYKSEDGRYILPAGTIFMYNKNSGKGIIVDEANIPDIYSDEYFGDNYYYMTLYNLILNPDPLYAAFYLTISNKDKFFSFNWVNENSIMQFVTNRLNFRRNLLTDQSRYKLSFKMAQSIGKDFGLYSVDSVKETKADGSIVQTKVISNNIKCVLVLYKDDVAYRWTEAELVDYNFENFVSSWELYLNTDNAFDSDNDIRINKLNVVGSSTDKNYGYFSSNTKAVLYTLAKFDEGEFGRYDLDSIAPGFEGYTVTNVYEIESGLDFYENFTDVLNTKVEAVTNRSNLYTVTGLPAVGFHYMIDETNVDYLLDTIYEKKAYIDYCLNLLENNMDIDFKFFNTYGPSLTYTIGDKEETPIGHVDLCMNFRTSLKNVSDIYTKDELTNTIKGYIENLYETGNLHIPNMISDITKQFATRINYLEFMNYNNFRLGLQHITKVDPDNPHIPPEFLNIRNKINDKDQLEPDINIEVAEY